jgi:hypothetical protein
VIHRIRAAHAAQRERAPEDVVRRLPWRVWTGSGWEKHEGVPPDKPDQNIIPTASTNDVDVELGQTHATNPTTSTQADEDEDPIWFNTQVECAICLDEFVKGDRVRVLPCKHIFHLDEVDEWLIQLKKLVSQVTRWSLFFVFMTHARVPVPYLQGRRYLPSPIIPSGSYQQFSTRTRSILGPFSPVTALKPIREDSATSGCHQGPKLITTHDIRVSETLVPMVLVYLFRIYVCESTAFVFLI